MPTVEELASKYGSGDATEAVITPHADLINRYGSGTITAEAPAQVDIRTPSPENFERSKTIAAETAAVNAKKPVEFSKLPIAREMNKGLKESSNLIGEGIQDFTKGNVASSVGKVALGTGMGALNAIGFLPVLNEAENQLTKITGNPEFASRAGLVATGGLPITKTAKVITDLAPSSRAVKTIVDAVGPENLPGFIAQLKSNPRLTAMDVDPNVQIIAQGLAAKPGDPRHLLDKVVRGRTDTKLDTVTGAIDEAMGVPVNVLEKVEGLKKTIRETGKEINPIVTNANPVDITPVITSIDAKLKPGVNSVITVGEPLPLGDIEKSLERVKNFITDGLKNRTDAKSLHSFQSSLRAKAEDLLSSTSGQDRQLGRALMDVRNQVVSAIDNAAGGTYRPALAKYRDVNDIEDAFKKGQSVTKNRLGNLDDDPAYWDKWIKQATPAELEAAKEGARLAYAHQMGTVTNAARKGTDIPLIEFNKEKLNLLFGKAEVDKMAKTLADEKLIADTNSKLFQGSMTAMRTLGAKATAERPKYEPNYSNLLPLAAEGLNQYVSGGSLPIALATGYGYMGLRKGMTSIGQKLDRKTNIEIADLAAATGEAKEALIKALQDHIPRGKLSLAQKSMLALPIAKP